ncbi:MAG: PHB depolymerase family esterase [Streptosporangiaceae bacterium]|nr:PHB depolymerase family esterase [Streptosporangiaceae bacterium]MBV9857171.1 PHB depolymerase family esterase [Streptosporangiaceae bacterium]
MLRSLFRKSRLAAIALAAAAAAGVSVQAAPHASAASLVQVTNFGNNPSNLLMYIYVPASVRPNPPILLGLHGCSGSGPYFYQSTDFASLADQYGFIVIYPSVTRSFDCWDVSSSQALTRNGGSDPVGLMSMITYTEQHYGGNPNQVYVTGSSSGGMMTNVMLGDYPDVFKAGAAFMGVPFGCFYTGTVDGWNSACAQGQVTNTPQAWGDMVRNADPGYNGPRPRVQLWHGTADGTISYNNFGEEIKQWTNVLGVSQTPSSTDTPVSGWTRTRYDNSAGVAEVEAYSIAGAGHVLPVQGSGMAAYAIHFFGLDSTAQGNQVSVTSPGSQTTAAGTAASVQVHATDSAAGQTLTYSAAGLPAGLSISPSTGLISGTPTTAGTSTVTVTATDTTGATGSATFTWTVSSGTTGGGSCHVTYQTTSQWAGGFTASVTITNTSTAALAGWKLTFTFPGDQHITNGWNGTVSQSGENVTITNASYNGAIPASGSTSAGFQGTWTSSDAAPASFSLNGTACS